MARPSKTKGNRKPQAAGDASAAAEIVPLVPPPAEETPPSSWRTSVCSGFRFFALFSGATAMAVGIIYSGSENDRWAAMYGYTATCATLVRLWGVALVVLGGVAHASGVATTPTLTTSQQWTCQALSVAILAQAAVCLREALTPNLLRLQKHAFAGVADETAGVHDSDASAIPTFPFLWEVTGMWIGLAAALGYASMEEPPLPQPAEQGQAADAAPPIATFPLTFLSLVHYLQAALCLGMAAVMFTWPQVFLLPLSMLPDEEALSKLLVSCKLEVWLLQCCGALLLGLALYLGGVPTELTAGGDGSNNVNMILQRIVGRGMLVLHGLDLTVVWGVAFLLNEGNGTPLAFGLNGEITAPLVCMGVDVLMMAGYALALKSSSMSSPTDQSVKRD